MKGEKRGREGEMEKGGEKGGLAGEGEKHAAKSGHEQLPWNGQKRNASLTTRAQDKERNRIESGVMDIRFEPEFDSGLIDEDKSGSGEPCSNSI